MEEQQTETMMPTTPASGLTECNPQQEQGEAGHWKGGGEAFS